MLTDKEARELISLNLVKENGVYFWGRAFVGTTKAAAIKTVMEIRLNKAAD